MTIQGISYHLCSTKISTCVAHRTLELVGGTRANEVHLCPLAVQKYLLSKSLTYEYGHVNDTRIHSRAFHFSPSNPTPPQIFAGDGVAGADCVRTGNTISSFFWVGGGKCRAVSARSGKPWGSFVRGKRGIMGPVLHTTS